MKLLSYFAIFIALISSCQGYSFVIPARLPGICMFHGVMLPRGDNNMLSSCQNMHCNEDGSILVQGCGHYDIRDCRVVDPINLNKPYPDCCQMNFLCNSINGQIINKDVIPTQMGIYA